MSIGPVQFECAKHFVDLLSKPKALIGLNQKVSGLVQGFPLPLPSLSSHRRTGRA